MFTTVVSKLTDSRRTKSERQNKKTLEAANKNSFFHFFSSYDSKFHKIDLSSPLWPPLMTIEEKLKFVGPENIGETIPLFIDKVPFEAKYIACTDELSTSFVAKEMEKKIEKTKDTSGMNISFSEIQKAACSQRWSQEQQKSKKLSDFFGKSTKSVNVRKPCKPTLRDDLNNTTLQRATILDSDDDGNEKENEPEVVLIKSKIDGENVLPQQVDATKKSERTELDQPPVVDSDGTCSIFSENEEDVAVDSRENQEPQLNDLPTSSSDLNKVLKEVHGALRDCVEALNTQRRESRTLRKLIENGSGSREVCNNAENCTPCEKILVNGELMNDLPGETPEKYGINLFKKFFDLNERCKGLAQPIASSKSALDAERMGKIQRLVEARFPGRWFDARKSINGCVRDSRKKVNKLSKNEVTQPIEEPSEQYLANNQNEEA